MPSTSLLEYVLSDFRDFECCDRFGDFRVSRCATLVGCGISQREILLEEIFFMNVRNGPPSSARFALLGAAGQEQSWTVSLPVLLSHSCFRGC